MVVTTETALSFYDAGLTPIPPKQDGTKAPDLAEWKSLSSERPSREHVAALFAGDQRTGIGVLTGKVSGGLECFEFDDLPVYEEYVAAARATGWSEPATQGKGVVTARILPLELIRCGST